MKLQFRTFHIAFPRLDVLPGYERAQMTIIIDGGVPNAARRVRVEVPVPNDRALSLGELEVATFKAAKEAIEELAALLSVNSFDELERQRKENEAGDGMAFD